MIRRPTKCDVLVSAVCLLLAIANLSAVGNSGRRRAKEYVCLSNLRCWGAAFDALVRDNDGYFLSAEGGGSGRWWIESLEPYFGESKLLLCPEATEPPGFGGIGRLQSAAWRVGAEYVGSYGINGWICNPASARTNVWGRSPVSSQWRHPNVQGREEIPVFADMWWVDAWPRHTDVPPALETGPADRVNVSEMERVCVNRHDGAVNCLFMDWSARKVGLKELWTLRWHRQFHTAGPWTKAGGVRPEDWPEWMRQFKDH